MDLLLVHRLEPHQDIGAEARALVTLGLALALHRGHKNSLWCT
jgi:hypothetical protein